MKIMQYNKFVYVIKNSVFNIINPVYIILAE